MCECPTLYDETFVKARKQARCCECRARITVGELYQRVSGLWDGSFSTYKTCGPCAELRDEMTKRAETHDCCDGPTFGDLLQWVIDADLYEPDDPALGAFRARNAAAVAAWKAERTGQPTGPRHE